MKKRGSSFLAGFVIFIISLAFNVPSQTDIGQEVIDGISQSNLCDEWCVAQAQHTKTLLFIAGVFIMVGTFISLISPILKWIRS